MANSNLLTVNGKLMNRREGISIISYNLHGFNQGSNLLQSLCSADDSPDLVFVQEHWLTPANLYKIKQFSKNYNGYGISAMDKVISDGILRGRPYGGTCVLVKSYFCNKIVYSHCKERFVVIAFNDTIFVNVYFPSVHCDDDYDILIDVISDIENTFEVVLNLLNKTHLNFVIGGDLNVDLDSGSRAAAVINEFMDNWLLISCHKVLPGNIQYSYCHETLQQYSLIDYFLIGRLQHNVSKLKHYSILEEACNLSDHLPVKILLDISIGGSGMKSTDADFRREKAVSFINWVGSDKSNFYEYTRVVVEPAYHRLCKLRDKVKAIKALDDNIFTRFALHSIGGAASVSNSDFKS
jgi:exonuclease III